MIAWDLTQAIECCTYQQAAREPKGTAQGLNSLHKVCLAQWTVLNNNPLNFKPVLRFPEQKRDTGEVI